MLVRMGARFADLAAASEELRATRLRLEKRRIAAALLARLAPDEIAPAVGWLVAEPVCGPLGVGPTRLWELSKTEAPDHASLTLREVEAVLADLREGPRDEAGGRVAELFAWLTPAERALFAGALTGSLRQGSLGGVMLLALADRTGTPEAEVRRVAMVTGSVTRAAAALLGKDGAPVHALTLFTPLAPMLAEGGHALEEALAAAPNAVLDWKVDGVRAQAHKQGARVTLYSRSGHELGEGCAPVRAALAAIAAESAVLDGEIVLEGPDGRPRPFQDTFSAIASGAVPEGDALRFYGFDCMHLDGRDVVDEPLEARLGALARALPPELRMPHVLRPDAEAARRFQEDALARGHEGVMVKDLGAPYRFGARGRAWQKVKRHETADLVVLAVEWGSGRRKGWLSNLHLGARRDDGTFSMVGKTFKGLTEALLAWQTAELLAREVRREGHVVFVRPELVVEVRYDGVQRSPRYPGGIALRFARVVRYREDKRAEDAEALGVLQAQAPGPAPRERGGPKKKPGARQLSLFDE
jgi:DNA ligase-1